MVGIVLNVIFVVVEFGAGILSNSLALISDAGHNLSDVATLALALGAFRLMALKATKKFTYGFRKVSVLIALVNAILLAIVVAGIAYKSVQRFLSPQPVDAEYVIWVAGVGIVINALSGLLFYRNKEDDLNIKGAYLHLMADALVSVGVVITGIVIYYTQWHWVDPAISLLIVIVLIVSLWSLLRDSVSLSLDAVPKILSLTQYENGPQNTRS
jgi:cobalt-zinc-cadmium efflux system protein